MTIKFDINLPNETQARLASAIGCKESDLEQSLAPYALAATAEYVAMIAGNGIPGRVSDLQEFRLLQIILSVYDGQAPQDLAVSRLLHVTPSRCATLVRNIFAKYDYEMRAAKTASLKEALVNAKKPNAVWLVQIGSQAIVGFANEVLTANSYENSLLERDGTSAGTYAIKAREMKILCEIYGVKFDGLE